MFVVGASLVLSSFFPWFRSVHELLHASDTGKCHNTDLVSRSRIWEHFLFVYSKSKRKDKCMHVIICLTPSVIVLN